MPRKAIKKAAEKAGQMVKKVGKKIQPKQPHDTSVFRTAKKVQKRNQKLKESLEY